MEKYSYRNIVAFLQGYIRYNLYYSSCRFLIPRHILEQISYRIEIMDKECYNNGNCKLCGCKTTHLQMANKACDKPCYSKMLNRGDWNTFKNNNYV